MPLPALADPELVQALLQQGVHLLGHQSLAGGAIVVGLLWGGMAAFLIDGKYGRATVVATGASILTLIGLMHSAELGIHRGPVLQGYVVLAGVLGLLALFQPKGAGRSAQGDVGAGAPGRRGSKRSSKKKG